MQCRLSPWNHWQQGALLTHARHSCMLSKSPDSWNFGFQALLWCLLCPMTAGMSAPPALGLLPPWAAEGGLSQLREHQTRAVKAISLLNLQAHQLTVLTHPQVMQCFLYLFCVRHVPRGTELCCA